MGRKIPATRLTPGHAALLPVTARIEAADPGKIRTVPTVSVETTA